MAFWDSVGEKVSEATANTMRKMKDFGDTAKLQGQISAEEKKIDNLYREIGKLYCYLHGGSPEGQFVQLVNQVRDARRLVEQYNQQIQQIKGVTVCPKCGTQVEATAAFCPKCGTMMGQ